MGKREKTESVIQWLNKQTEQKTAAEGARGGNAVMTIFLIMSYTFTFTICLKKTQHKQPSLEPVYKRMKREKISLPLGNSLTDSRLNPHVSPHL